MKSYLEKLPIDVAVTDLIGRYPPNRFDELVTLCSSTSLKYFCTDFFWQKYYHHYVNPKFEILPAEKRKGNWFNAFKANYSEIKTLDYIGQKDSSLLWSLSWEERRTEILDEYSNGLQNTWTYINISPNDDEIVLIPAVSPEIFLFPDVEGMILGIPGSNGASFRFSSDRFKYEFLGGIKIGTLITYPYYYRLVKKIIGTKTIKLVIEYPEEFDPEDPTYENTNYSGLYNQIHKYERLRFTKPPDEPLKTLTLTLL